jgi:hypothetical protein
VDGKLRPQPIEDEGRIGRLRDVLTEARPMILDGWVDGFLRDVDPESEIRLIETCAVVYRRLTAKATLTPEEKRESLEPITEHIDPPKGDSN